MTAVFLLVILGTTIWVGFDASRRDWSQQSFANATWKWVLGCVLLWVVAFPAYLVQRGKAPVKA